MKKKRLSSHLDLRVTSKGIMKARLCKVCIRREIKSWNTRASGSSLKNVFCLLMGQITCAEEFDRNKDFRFNISSR